MGFVAPILIMVHMRSGTMIQEELRVRMTRTARPSKDRYGGEQR